MNTTQLSLDLSQDYRPHDRDWERCLWLEEILQQLPIDFLFDEDCHVVEVEDNTYVAIGMDPHQWQEFIWLGDDNWELGDSDTGNFEEPRVAVGDFAFILGELRMKEPMPLKELQAMRAWLND